MDAKHTTATLAPTIHVSGTVRATMDAGSTLAVLLPVVCWNDVCGARRCGV